MRFEQRFYSKAGLLQKTLVQVCFCEFCEISKNIYFAEHVRTAASTILSVVRYKIIMEYNTLPL